MAISDDTAALVAAQLTAAWASHVNRIPSGHGVARQEVTSVYQHFRQVVSGAPGVDRPYDPSPYSG